jgi:hypothetical protein
MEEDVETRSGKLKSLRRRVAEDWLDGSGKETALSVLDEMVIEAAGESRHRIWISPGSSYAPSSLGCSAGRSNRHGRPGCQSSPW